MADAGEENESKETEESTITMPLSQMLSSVKESKGMPKMAFVLQRIKNDW